MQTEATDLVDFAGESADDRSGCTASTNAAPGRSARKCLMARRLVERGVRFVQVYSDGEWDAHSDLAGNHTGHCAATDVPIDGLLTDLKRRGLLDSTLVIWGGEFGRMPVSQGQRARPQPAGLPRLDGGAGIKGGASHGETDEIGYRAAVDPVTVHDLHATMLHLLGLDHKRLDLPPQRPPLPADRRGRRTCSRQSWRKSAAGCHDHRSACSGGSIYF